MEREFNDLQKRALQEMDGQVRLVRRRASSINLTDHILERGGIGSAAPMEAMYEVSEFCRQSSGRAPEGVWFPLAAMARSLTISADSGAAALVATNGAKVGSELQAALMPQSAVLGAATVLTGLQGGAFDLIGVGTPVNPSGSWHSEVGASSELLPVLKPIALVPMTVRFYLDISRMLLVNRKMDVERAMRAEMTRRVLADIDRAAYVGNSADEPTGLFYNPDVQLLSAGANGAAPAWDHLVEMEYQVGTRLGDDEIRAPYIITSPLLRKKLRKTPKAAGLDFILGDASSRVMGLPLRSTTHSPDNLTKGTSAGVCSAMLYGDLSELIVGFFGPAAVDVLVDPVTRSAQGMVRVHFRADVAVAARNPGAFAAYKDLLSA
jgi:HK97 family phage major capsid protein